MKHSPLLDYAIDLQYSNRQVPNDAYPSQFPLNFMQSQAIDLLSMCKNTWQSQCLVDYIC
jgi:hypothetical protein